MKKGPLPKIGDTVANRHARQVTAAMEGEIPNAGDAVRYRHARQIAAFPEGPTPNSGDRFPIIDGRNRQRSRGSLFTIFDGNGVFDDFIRQRIRTNLINPAEQQQNCRCKSWDEEFFHYAIKGLILSKPREDG